MLFQGYHCRMIPFLEVGDIARARAELARIVDLADEVRYPHARWSVTAFSANFASLQGRLADEERLTLEAGEAGGSLLTDINANAHVASHLFRVRREQGRPGEALEPVRTTASSLPWYAFLKCELADLYLELGDQDAARAVYDDLATDGFAALPRDNEWIFGLTLLAPVAVRLGDLDGASTIYGWLHPYAGRHAVGHPEGTTGSVSLTLGILATAMSRLDDAERHLRFALEHNERMGAVLWAAYSQLEFARMLLVRDLPRDRERANELLSRVLETAQAHAFVRLHREIETLVPTAATVGASGVSRASHPADGIFRREGEYWSVAFDGRAFRLRDSKGVRYLSHLLSAPGREIHALELVAVVEGHSRDLTPTAVELTSEAGDAGELLDERAKAEYRDRLRDLESQLAEAEGWNDPERASRLRAERDFLAGELASAVGLGGRDRRAASNAERARVNVTRAIRSAIARIAEHGPELGTHLSATVRTGTFCSYQPDPRARVTWST